MFRIVFPSQNPIIIVIVSTLACDTVLPLSIKSLTSRACVSYHGLIDNILIPIIWLNSRCWTKVRTIQTCFNYKKTKWLVAVIFLLQLTLKKSYFWELILSNRWPPCLDQDILCQNRFSKCVVAHQPTSCWALVFMQKGFLFQQT